MIATAKIGGTYTAYSSRFTLSGMTGPPETAAIRSAVTALGSSSVGPADVNVSLLFFPPLTTSTNTLSRASQQQHHKSQAREQQPQSLPPTPPASGSRTISRPVRFDTRRCRVCRRRRSR